MTVAMNAAMFTLTVSFSTVMDPDVSPVKAATSCSCATRLAETQASAKASLCTTRSTWLRVKLSIPFASGTLSAWSWVGQLRRQPLVPERFHRLRRDRLDVDVGEYLGGDLVGDGVLYCRLIGERAHRRDVPIGVGDLIAAPDRHD